MSFYMSLFLPFFAGLLIAIALTPVAIRLAPKIGAVDIPKDNRRMHKEPIPRFGGMAIAAAALIAMLIAIFVSVPMLTEYFNSRPHIYMLYQPVSKLYGVLAGGVLIYILGVVDDLKDLPAKVKFLGQIGVACVAFAFGIRIEFVTNHFGTFFGDTHSYFPGVVCFLITVIWIVGITNTVNLIDGLDGLAAGVSAIASLCIAYTAYIHGSYIAALAMLAVAGSACGFLKYNFHPAKIFMGDSGSLFLGYMLATLTIIGPTKGATVFAMIIPVIVLGLPIFDTGFAIFRRIVNHRPIMEADKGHLHHRLMAAGFGQRRTVMMLYGISGMMGVASVLFTRDLFVETFGLIAITAMYILVFLTDANSMVPHIRVPEDYKPGDVIHVNERIGSIEDKASDEQNVTRVEDIINETDDAKPNQTVSDMKKTAEYQAITVKDITGEEFIE